MVSALQDAVATLELNASSAQALLQDMAALSVERPQTPPATPRVGHKRAADDVGYKTPANSPDAHNDWKEEPHWKRSRVLRQKENAKPWFCIPPPP